MASEDRIAELKRLMVSPDSIRNVCTSAHIHHGKCVTGDARVLLADGHVRTAKELYEQAEALGIKYEENDGYIIYDISNQNIRVFSLNQQTGKIEKRSLSQAWKLKGGRIIKVKLRNGFEIASTPEHKYIVLEDMDFIEKPASELKLGDNVVCPRGLDIESIGDIQAEILQKLRKENFYVYLHEDFGKEIKERIQTYGIEKLCKFIDTPLKAKSFYHGIWQKRLTLDDFLKICDLFKISNQYNKIDYIVHRTGKQRGHNSIPMKLPQDFKDFFYLAGLFVGDGTRKRFIVGKEDLRFEFLRICKDLECSVVRKDDRRKTPALETNNTLMYMLHALFDYPLRKKSHNVRVSDLVFRSKKDYAASFLRGYFDTDGTVEKARRAISISSASKQMIRDLGLLLLRFNVVPIVQGDTVYISGFSARSFVQQIGFGIKQKAQRANLLIERCIGSYVTDWLNVTTTSRINLANRQQLLQQLVGQKQVHKILSDDLVYIQVAAIEESYAETVYDFTVPETHTFVAEGVVMHNTALTDNLLAASGFMSTKAAGSLEEGMATWQHADEQERLLTVDSANVSMVHTFNNDSYLINLIDTPGHIDFGGNVTRAMRAIDGTIVLVCAVEGIMPQTETVVKQALRERVKPVLFINKVDRLINELKLTPEKMQERFLNIIIEFNGLVEQVAEEEFKQKWKVDINDGSVAFGSARENWALSVPYMKKNNVTFKDIINLYSGTMTEEQRQDWTWKNAALHEVLLNMVIKHLPNPKEAQIYRIPKIWHGDLESPFGKDLVNCNQSGKVAFVITRVMIDPKFNREMAAGRLFSGTLREGMTIYLNNAKQSQRVSQIFMYQGVKPEMIDNVPAGNVLALGGISGNAGETITEGPEEPFEELRHIFEPVITKSIEPMKPQDLPKLVEILKKVAKEDPSLKVTINQETGENLIHGMGELHLEIIENRIKTERGFDIKTSQPIVVYRETLTKESSEFEGKSPNKHNKFYFIVEPIEAELYNLIKAGELPTGRLKKVDPSLYPLFEKAGYIAKEAKKIKEIFNGNVFIDGTRGIVQISEVMELVLDGFEQVMKEGPLAREPCVKLKITLTDTKLHEDAIHRGPAQVLPAVRQGIKGAMLEANAVMFEPLQVIQIDAPTSYLGEISKLVQNKRGQLLDTEQQGDYMSVKAKMPVAESFGLANDLRSATSGRGNYFMVDQLFERLPTELQQKVIKQIRERKGLKVDEDMEEST